METRAGAMHLTVLRIGKQQFVVGSVQAEELQRDIGQRTVFFGQFHARDVFAHLHHGILQAGIEQVHLLNQ